MVFSLKEKFKIWWLQAFLTFISSGFLSLVYFYFVKKHVSFGLIFLADFLGYIVIISFILFNRHLRFRNNIRLGFILIALAMLILLLPFDPNIIIFPYAILSSFGSIVFFCPYNILYFRELGKGNLAHDFLLGNWYFGWCDCPHCWWIFVGNIKIVHVRRSSDAIFVIGHLFDEVSKNR